MDFYTVQSARLLGFFRNENCENPRRLNSVMELSLLNLRDLNFLLGIDNFEEVAPEMARIQ